MRKKNNEKKAFLVLYIVGLVMAMAIFLYLTKIEGYIPEEITKVTLIVYLSVLIFVFIGGIIILKYYGARAEETNL
ncbi:hypothetical protein [Thermococcus sibiricus]|uniref:Uncharacterized protein n=1 Tax=Thermococcus sibiricus TaxID=172049 RepID=A0A101ELW2_9EURY|nr:hypothetical protein [Thermococcus sibiricus]KUK17757.1 MAG: Uncharacterized protein XD54_0943 [Thermococcus sibiricus]MBC7109236.1 hypothetical protein [Methanomassiliicoccales archaeon]